MRLNNICDKMNQTGCDELHLWEQIGTGLKHFLYTHQIELGVIMSICLIGFVVFLWTHPIGSLKNKGRKIRTQKVLRR